MPTVFAWLAAVAIPWAILVALLIFFVTNPDKLYFWLGKGLALLAWTRKSVRQRSVAAQIEGQVNAFRESVQTHTEGILPYGLRVESHTMVDPEAFVQGDTVVVRMGYQANPEKNLVTAALSYCSRAVVPRARPYLERCLLRSADLIVTKKMLAESGARSSLEYFWDNVFEPECRGDSGIQRYCAVMDDLDDKGFFTRILLREFLEFGNRIYPRALREPARFAEESKAFVDYLNNLSLRAPGEDVQLDFFGDHIKVGVILIARATTVALSGLGAYIKWARIYKQRGAHAVYICARSYNIQAARATAQAIETEGHGAVVSESVYKTSGPGALRRSAVCITIQPSSVESTPLRR